MVEKLIKAAVKRFRNALHNPYEVAGLSWFDIKKLKHEAKGIRRKINVMDSPMHYSSPQDLVHGINEIFVEGIYDQELAPNAFVIDCGANIGLSVIKWKMLQPTCRVLAFEPDAENYDLLVKNIRERSYENICVEKKAVWISDEPLFFEESGSMSSKISTEGGTNTVQTNAVRLKDLIHEPVDFLKMDIEGAEYAVLNDIRDQLHFVKKMFVEYHGSYGQNGELLDALNILRKTGFNIYIKEATPVYKTPFLAKKSYPSVWDLQLNIFCTRK